MVENLGRYPSPSTVDAPCLPLGVHSDHLYDECRWYMFWYPINGYVDSSFLEDNKSFRKMTIEVGRELMCRADAYP